MQEIEFSVMEGRPGESEDLLPLLEAFEKQHHIHVNLVAIPWETAWTQNVKYGIYGNGPDVSAVGADWIGSLASMQALRPFTQQDLRALGGAETYFSSAWQAGQLMNNPATWAIPWQGDVRVIYYWKDLLKAAGIDNVDEAFQTDAALVETLEKLQKAGYATPLAINTQAISQVLHEAAHWLWAAGGDFISPDGKRVIFNEPQAIEGFKNYFSLRPYLPEQSLVTAPLGFFLERTSPIHISGLWVPTTIAEADWQAQLGVAKLPGVAYTGGTSLVIWQYSTKAQPAFELVRFLSAQPVISTGPHYNQLPTRREALETPLTQNDAFNRTYLQAFQAGRSFPTLRLWGSIEDRLIPVLANLWQEILSNPEQDLETCLHKHLDPLAARLNIVLEN